METWLLASSLVLAAVFATAGVGKLMDLAGARRALADFGVPSVLVGPGAILLPVAELAIAVSLIFPPSARSGALAAAMLLLAFVLGIANALRQGRAPDCHCFGQLHSEPAGASTLVRNGVLLALAVIVAGFGPAPAVDDWIADRTALELLLVVTALVAIGIAAFHGLAWLGRREGAREEARSATQRGAEERPRGLPPGTPAPPFTARTINGEVVTIEDLLARGRPVVLVFVSFTCPSCRGLVPLLGQWHVTLADRLTITPITEGSVEHNRALAESYGPDGFLVNEARDARAPYATGGTPSAVVIAPDGIIASATAGGAWGVEELIRVTLRRTERQPESSAVA